MFPTRPSISQNLKLEEVLHRLQQQAAVTGLVVTGTGASNQLQPESDYDLIVILDSMPVPLHVALTTIDERLTDVIFMRQTTLESMLISAEPFDPDDLTGKLISWLQQGQIMFDRYGHLEQLHTRFPQHNGLQTAADYTVYGRCFSINYNLRQTRRMLKSTDPVYQFAVELRYLYTFSELWLAYFQIRHIPWRGEKAAIRYVEQHDPVFLKTFRQMLAENEQTRKMALYEQVAASVLDPVGGLWNAEITAIAFDSPVQMSDVHIGLAFWDKLLAAPKRSNKDNGRTISNF